jgi:hypothetical protein
MIQKPTPTYLADINENLYSHIALNTKVYSQLINDHPKLDTTYPSVVNGLTSCGPSIKQNITQYY